MADLPDIFTGISRPDLFDAFKQQLKKDFESCGIEAAFADKLLPDYEAILKAVAQEMQKLLKGSKWMELLYRIDISENQVRRLSKEKPDQNQDEALAELIIKRELQKVVIKAYFKKNE